jgi:hypothetical protein
MGGNTQFRKPVNVKLRDAWSLEDKDFTPWLAGRRDAPAFRLESGRMCVMLSRDRQACAVVGRSGVDQLLAEFPDAAPIFLDEPEKFLDGWEANSLVLDHLVNYRLEI